VVQFACATASVHAKPGGWTLTQVSPLARSVIACDPDGADLQIRKTHARKAGMFAPRLDTLPAAQVRLWGELEATPDIFALYGGTAIALRLGHRESVDFDFFSSAPFVPAELGAQIPYLRGGRLLRAAPNTLTIGVERGGPVQVSYFGGLSLGQVAPHDVVEGPRLKVASLVDLSGMKAAVVTQRAEVKDYLDLHALLTQARIPLPTMLSAAAAIYGEEFSPLVSLKAMSYHDDDALADLPHSMRRDLIAAVRGVDIGSLPRLDAVRPRGERL
jgi:hypothetical protein